MKKIAVGHRQYALVDNEDYEWITRWKWHLNPQGYAVRKVYIDGRKAGSYTVMMHRIIAGTPENMHTDHKDGNPLNNQKSNLRVCVNDENARNRKIYKNNTSGFKGVHWSKTRKKWFARVSKGTGKRILVGAFDTAEEAAIAYNVAAIEYYGEYARLNVLPDAKEIK